MDKIRIASRGDHFRRAGLDFTREGRIFEPGELTPEQITAIAEEPQLIVSRVVDAGEKTDAKADDGEKKATGDSKGKAR